MLRVQVRVLRRILNLLLDTAIWCHAINPIMGLIIGRLLRSRCIEGGTALLLALVQVLGLGDELLEFLYTNKVELNKKVIGINLH